MHILFQMNLDAVNVTIYQFSFNSREIQSYKELKSMHNDLLTSAN